MITNSKSYATDCLTPSMAPDFPPKLLWHMPLSSPLSLALSALFWHLILLQHSCLTYVSVHWCNDCHSPQGQDWFSGSDCGVTVELEHRTQRLFHKDNFILCLKGSQVLLKCSLVLPFSLRSQSWNYMVTCRLFHWKA